MGYLAFQILSLCPEATFVGSEIQLIALGMARRLLSNFTHAHVYHCAWSDHSAENLKILTNAEGDSEGGGLISTEEDLKRNPRGLSESDYEVSVLTLEEFAIQHRIEKALLLIIDTEGHEPLVIKGMHLENDVNRKRFSFLHYELGGTWAERDSRHPPGSMTQYQTALYLDALGYEIYMIGCNGFLPVEPAFFNNVENFTSSLEQRNEGFGFFVQGNALAMYRSYANPFLVRVVDSNIIVVES